MWGRFITLACLSLILGKAALAESAGFVDRFKTIGSDWYVAEYDFDHNKFDTDWRRDQIILKASDKTSGIHLNLDPHQGGINRFAGASLRREDPSHYGRYEVRMRAASGPGVVTGFFTYSGPHYGTRHDEIDIEFLGRNTKQMHVAWFVDGKLKNRYIDLEFDASKEMVDYAFEWHPGKLRWFAKGALIFETDAVDGAIPQIPGRLFVNIWAADPSISGWAGLVGQNTRAEAHIERVRFTPFTAEGRSSP